MCEQEALLRGAAHRALARLARRREALDERLAAAEHALEALKQMQSATAKCIRGGELVPDLPAEELVPGDIVEIGVGDKVPADVRILRLKTTTVRTDEGALTGESETVMKQTEPVAKSVRIQAKLNMMFAGTTVSNGAAVGVVTATGMRTEIGKIQANVQEAKEDEGKQERRKGVEEMKERPRSVEEKKEKNFMVRLCGLRQRGHRSRQTSALPMPTATAVANHATHLRPIGRGAHH